MVWLQSRVTMKQLSVQNALLERNHRTATQVNVVNMSRISPSELVLLRPAFYSLSSHCIPQSAILVTMVRTAGIRVASVWRSRVMLSLGSVRARHGGWVTPANST